MTDLDATKIDAKKVKTEMKGPTAKSKEDDLELKNKIDSMASWKSQVKLRKKLNIVTRDPKRISASNLTWMKLIYPSYWSVMMKIKLNSQDFSEKGSSFYHVMAKNAPVYGNIVKKVLVHNFTCPRSMQSKR